MVKLLVTVAFEVVVGVALGGAVLAVVIPVLSHFGLIGSEGMAGALVITGGLVIAVGFMVLRPGSALNRRFER